MTKLTLNKPHNT